MAVHPHGRGDGARAGTAPSTGRRFTPTGVGTALAPLRKPFRRPGSPPRAWGRRRRRKMNCGGRTVHPHGRGDGIKRVYRRVACVRFTPTGVGTAARPAVPTASAAVHPHGRGDGWPPWRAFCKTIRFTPTGVGTAASSQFAPRVGDGSPPRAWGRRVDVLRNPLSSRFTPTGVSVYMR